MTTLRSTLTPSPLGFLTFTRMDSGLDSMAMPPLQTELHLEDSHLNGLRDCTLRKLKVTATCDPRKAHDGSDLPIFPILQPVHTPNISKYQDLATYCISFLESPRLVLSLFCRLNYVFLNAFAHMNRYLPLCTPAHRSGAQEGTCLAWTGITDQQLPLKHER